MVAAIINKVFIVCVVFRHLRACVICALLSSFGIVGAFGNKMADTFVVLRIRDVKGSEMVAANINKVFKFSILILQD